MLKFYIILVKKIGTQEEAAEAYDIAAIKFRGLNAVTNFDMSRYDVKSIASSNLPIGGMSSNNRSKNSSDQSVSADSKSCAAAATDDRGEGLSSASSSTLSFALPIKQDHSENYWSNIFAFPNPSAAKNPSGTTSTTTLFLSNPNSSVLPFNMDFSAAAPTTTTATTNLGFFGTSTSTTTTNTVPFALPIPGNNYDTSSSAAYDGSNNVSWNNIGTTHLDIYHHHHHQAHAKPPGSLFQTPIFGME